MSGTTYQLQRRQTPVVTTQLWASSHTNSQITLTNGSLSAAMSGATNYAKTFGRNGFGQNQFPAGKFYFEIVVNYSSLVRAGIANTNSALTGNLGSSIDEIGWQYDGSINNNGSVIATWSSFTTGQTLRFAVDLIKNLIWGRVNVGPWNNSSTANPSTGVGGTSIPSGVYAYPVVPALLLYQSSLPDHSVAYFATASWAYTPPIGFVTMDVSTSTAWASVGSPLTTPPFSVNVTGLTTHTSYDYQVLSQNGWGQTPSSILTVTTT